MRFLGVICTISLFFACKSEPTFNPELIVGTWNGVDWRVQGKSSGRDAAAVSFVFAPYTGQGSVEGAYIAVYGDQKEKGLYKLKGNKLYTTAEDKIEKVVRIIHISADTLVLGMNRMGQDEELVLVERH
jgi:Lipocalin-like domain